MADPNLLTATGEFVSPSKSEVAPKMPGRVAAVYVDEGSRVSRGQTLLTMETDYARLAIQGAEELHGKKKHQHKQEFGDYTAAATALHVHPNTLRYRLGRAQQIADIRLDDPEERLALMLLVRLLNDSA